MRWLRRLLRYLVYAKNPGVCEDCEQEKESTHMRIDPFSTLPGWGPRYHMPLCDECYDGRCWDSSK
jgi:hypothetical protein